MDIDNEKSRECIAIFDKISAKLHSLSATKVILLGYCLIILIGSGLLSLPIAVRSPYPVSFSQSLFTATSATCVTGLVCVDTWSHWTLFGQAIILIMIQIGGIGFMTVCISALTFTKRKIGLASRSLMQSSISAPQVGGIVRTTKFILFGSAIIEMVGAVLLSFFFCPKMDFWRGIWYSVFHSVSAFCNAGFDLMSGLTGEQYSSFTHYSSSWYVNIVLMLLIITGGIGFLVWRDVLESKFRFSKMGLQTKIVLTVSAILIFGGAALIFFFEDTNSAFASHGLPGRILSSLFQSVTARTAGFNTLNIGTISHESRLLMMILMLIGGSAGSTAGGIKTTTFAVLMLTVFSTFRQKKSIEVFGRRLDDGITKTACCILTMYLFFALTGGVAIARFDHISLGAAVYESISAIATVGISVGITPSLSAVSHGILIFLMLFGRAGSLTMLLAFSSRKTSAVVSSLPLEKIQLG